MTIRAILVLILSLAFAASPLLVPGFGGFETSQFPVPLEDPPVQPAGYAFGIWGVIYLWLIAMGGYGAWMRRADAAWDATRPPLIVSLAVGAVWLPVAQASAVWATVLIWAMLGGALVALARAPERASNFALDADGAFTDKIDPGIRKVALDPPAPRRMVLARITGTPASEALKSLWDMA